MTKRKAARSDKGSRPLKKRNTTTAGRGAEAEGSMAGHVISRTDSSRVETSQSVSYIFFPPS